MVLLTCTSTKYAVVRIDATTRKSVASAFGPCVLGHIVRVKEADARAASSSFHVRALCPQVRHILHARKACEASRSKGLRVGECLLHLRWTVSLDTSPVQGTLYIKLQGLMVGVQLLCLGFVSAPGMCTSRHRALQALSTDTAQVSRKV